MTNSALALADPRRFPDAAGAPQAARRLYALAEESLGAATGALADRADAAIAATLSEMLDRRDGDDLSRLFARAPSTSVYRHLWRRLADAWNAAAREAALQAYVFGIPVVLVAGHTVSGTRVTLQGAIADPLRLVEILRTHGALRGNETITLANALVAAEAIELAHLPAWRRVGAHLVAGAPSPMVLAPSPITIGATEGAHLRFLVGTALAAPGAELLRDNDIRRFGAPLARALEAALAADGVTLLALPRAPSDLVFAVHAGRDAQREVATQLFLSQALRNLRMRYGEPSAVISAHRSPDAPLGGELRLSLSSPFAEREAEGFRCPLFAADVLSDVVKMLTNLLEDCRVSDVRIVAGIHDDRTADTNQLLLFKPDTMPTGRSAYH